MCVFATVSLWWCCFHGIAFCICIAALTGCHCYASLHWHHDIMCLNWERDIYYYNKWNRVSVLWVVKTWCNAVCGLDYVNLRGCFYHLGTLSPKARISLPLYRETCPRQTSMHGCYGDYMRVHSMCNLDTLHHCLTIMTIILFSNRPVL